MKWSAWHKNPFAAIKEIATAEQYIKSCHILADAVTWDILEADMLMAEVLDDIADQMSIVVKDQIVGEGETRYEQYAACYVTETN